MSSYRVFLSAVLLLAAGVTAQTPNETTAFVHVTALPMDRDGAQADWTVLVRGDRIVAAGPAAKTVVPAGARRINATGKFLMPGLIDTHVHVSVKDDLFLFVANGVTSVQGDGGAAQRTQEWARQIAEGKFLGPNYVNCD